MSILNKNVESIPAFDVCFSRYGVADDCTDKSRPITVLAARDATLDIGIDVIAIL